MAFLAQYTEQKKSMIPFIKRTKQLFCQLCFNLDPKEIALAKLFPQTESYISGCNQFCKVQDIKQTFFDNFIMLSISDILSLV